MVRTKCEGQGTAATTSSVHEHAAWTNRRASERATRAAAAGRSSGRRRFVDPTTCEREYTDAEVVFMLAMNEYKRRSGRMFPTWSEVLEVLPWLGYERVFSADFGEIARRSAGPI
jgi:hypothetical protein